MKLSIDDPPGVSLMVKPFLAGDGDNPWASRSVLDVAIKLDDWGGSLAILPRFRHCCVRWTENVRKALKNIKRNYVTAQHVVLRNIVD